MNLWQRFTGALTGLFSKSQGTRRFGSLFNWGWSWPGAWGANRAEQAAHYTGWPYVAIRRIAEEIAQHPPCVGFQREGGTSTKALKPWQRLRALSSVPTHDDIEPADPENPLVRLLKNPNPPDTGVTFWYKVGINLEAMGETFLWLILDGDGKPTEMYVLPSHWVWVKWKGRQGEEQDKGESDSLVDFYEVRAWGVAAGSANIVRLRPEEVIHIAYPGLLDPMRGYSSMQAGSLWVDNAKAIDRSQFAKFQNEVTASVALELDGSIAEPDQDQRERLKSLLAGYQGVDHVGEPIILPAGAKLTAVGRSGVEMDYLNSGTDARDKCLALWHVPKSVIGMTEEVNRASMAASMDYFRSGVIAFKLKLIGSVLTEKLAKRFDPTALIYHEVPPPHDPDAELARWQWGTAAGITEVNEARAWLGLEPKANGDRALVPTGVTPVDWNEAEPNYLDHTLGNDSTTTQGELDPQAIPGDVSGQPQIDQTPERAELLDKAGGLTGIISVIGQVSSGALPATAAARLLRLFYGLSQMDADALVADVQVQQPEQPGGPGGFGPGAGGEGKVEEPPQVPEPPKVEMPKGVEKRLRSIRRVLRQLQKTHANGKAFNEADHPRAEDGKFGSGGSGGDSATKPDRKELLSRLHTMPHIEGYSSDTVDPGFKIDMESGIRGNPTDEDMKNAPIVSLPVDSLVATQVGVSRQVMTRKIANPSEKPVIVVRHNGTNYIWDGTHQATLAKLSGETKVNAKILDYDPELRRPVRPKEAHAATEETHTAKSYSAGEAPPSNTSTSSEGSDEGAASATVGDTISRSPGATAGPLDGAELPTVPATSPDTTAPPPATEIAAMGIRPVQPAGGEGSGERSPGAGTIDAGNHDAASADGTASDSAGAGSGIGTGGNDPAVNGEGDA